MDGVEYSDLHYNNFDKYEDAVIYAAYNETEGYYLNEAELFELNTRNRHLVAVLAALDHELIDLPRSWFDEAS